MLDQLRAVDKTRLVTKFGAVDQQTLDLTLNTLQVVFSR
ncbi:hypothetical protein IMCC9480_2356 [Oxalobacteraceae bacterium IMCC9480]|nr:hypothetical protein IMCC9480_2356 [Oxalobacteraceae bacterium IMCC9480]